MGLIDFVKNAGSKLFGKDEEEAPKPDPAAEAQRKAASNGRRSDILTKRAAGLGVEIEGLKVDVDGDKATVSGTAKSQADREKIVVYVGNTHGIASVDDRIEVKEPEPEAVFYTVKSGDSLSKIAKAQYGNAMKYPVIFEANKPMLSDPDKIYPGQMLRIPPLED